MTGKPKIAFVSGGVPFGGSTIFLLHLVQGLRALGISSEIFSFFEDNPVAAEFSAAQTPVHVADDKKLIYEDRLSALYGKLAQFQPTAVFANLGAESLEMLRYVPRGVLRIAMVHEQSMNEGPPKYAEFLDGIGVVNPGWVELQRRLCPSVPCRFLAHGIPLPSANQMRGPNADQPLRLVYFGRLSPTKGTRLFPVIVHELRQRKIPFHWKIYGDGPDEPWLRQQFSGEIRAGHVALGSHLSRAALFAAIREHDVFLMASDHEGGPLTLLEAMAVGLVPVCNDTPCLVQEVVHAENGFIIPRKPALYAEALSALHLDRPRLERMSHAARKIISDQYGLEAMAQRYVDFLRALAPTPATVSWPAKIKPVAIRGLRGWSRLSQSTALGRQARRLAKRLGT